MWKNMMALGFARVNEGSSRVDRRRDLERLQRLPRSAAPSGWKGRWMGLTSDETLKYQSVWELELLDKQLVVTHGLI
jgi:hypothetical protein